MSSQYEFIVADERYDQEIERLLDVGTIPGLISLSTYYPNGFIKSLKKLDSHHEIILCLYHGEAIGMGVIEKREVIFNDEKQSLYYLSNLRFLPEHRGRFQLYNAYQYLAKRYETHKGYFLTSIMDDNLIARQTLTGDRKGIPPYLPVVELTTFILKRWCHKAGQDIKVLPASEVPIEDINAFLKSEGEKRSCFPEYRINELTGHMNNLSGLTIENCCAAIREGIVVGFLGALDVSSVKQQVVIKYHPLVKLFRRFYNYVSAYLPYPVLPNEGCAVNTVYAASVLIKDSQCDVLSHLLNYAISQLKPNQNLAIAFSNVDPLIKLLKSQWSLKMKSTIYNVLLNDNQSAVDLKGSVIDKPLYLELASL